MARILVVDDQVAIRNALREILENEKHEVIEAKDGVEALVCVKQKKPQLILLDVRMPNMDGMETLVRLNESHSDIPVIMISAQGDIEMAVEAVKKGAFDFLTKPMDLNRLLITVRNALDTSHLLKERNVLIKKAGRTKGTLQPIIGESDAIKRVKEMIELVAQSDSRVLITGENGTGKELVAKWIHEKSARREKLLVEVNCAAIPPELIESELFGHERGAFTSAHRQRAGKFELANEGTLFLDEIGDMSMKAQAKVLRALQEKYIMRVGGEKRIEVDVRVLAATNKDLHQLIQQNLFREDLYHRLAVIIIDVPPLRERRDDIPLLVNHFLDQISAEINCKRKDITPEAMYILQNKLPWTGNIRELRNVVERLVILSRDEITADDVNLHVVASTPQAKSPFEEFFSKFKSRDEIEEFLDKHYPPTNSN